MQIEISDIDGGDLDIFLGDSPEKYGVWSYCKEEMIDRVVISIELQPRPVTQEKEADVEWEDAQALTYSCPS